MPAIRAVVYEVQLTHLPNDGRRAEGRLKPPQRVGTGETPGATVAGDASRTALPVTGL